MRPETTPFEHGRIVIDPSICNGTPTVRGTRITAATVLGYLSAGDTPQDILAQYPDLTAEDISACLAFAGRLAGRRFTTLQSA